MDIVDDILDGVGDILEPIADKINLSKEKILDLKNRYSTKWVLYLFKILVATFMIGSAFVNMFINQSYIYVVNENGILKVITNFIKLALAMYMFDQFSRKLGYVKGIAAQTAKMEKEEPVAKMGMAGSENNNGMDLEGFGGYYNMFESKLGEWN